MEWKLYESYKKQDEKANEFVENYAQKVRDVKEGVTAAVDAYEELLRKEFAGEAVSTKKAKALSDIDKARAALQVAEEEASKANDYAHEHLAGEITLDDLIDDWNGNVVPTLRRDRVAAIKQQSYEGLKLYYGAIQDLMCLNAECSLAQGDIKEKVRKHRSKDGYRSLHDVANFNDVADHPKDTDWITLLKYNKVPDLYRKEEN
ncbi:hypothetical protein V7166_17810 [Bacillus thuringiensis]